MNKSKEHLDDPRTYTVWTDWNVGEYVKADLPPIALPDRVYFYLKGQEVKSYDKKLFMKYNSFWYTMENSD